MIRRNEEKTSIDRLTVAANTTPKNLVSQVTSIYRNYIQTASERLDPLTNFLHHTSCHSDPIYITYI